MYYGNRLATSVVLLREHFAKSPMSYLVTTNHLLIHVMLSVLIDIITLIIMKHVIMKIIIINWETLFLVGTSVHIFSEIILHLLY